MQIRLSLRKRVVFAAVVCIAASGALAVSGEMFLRLFGPAPAFAASLNMHTYLKTAWEPDLNGVSSPIRHTTNKWGLRGSDPPTGAAWDEATTIVTVGGSTTQCFYLDDANTWSAVMEGELQRRGHTVWVGNAGQDGHSTRGHLRLMDRVMVSVRPDYLVFLVGVNDLSLSLYGIWKKGNGFDRRMSTFALGVPRNDTLNWVLDRSRLAGRMYALKQVHMNGVLMRTPKWTTTIPAEPLEGRDDLLPVNIDDVLATLPLFRGNVAELIRRSRDLGATPVFLTQPLLFEDTEYWRGIWARTAWLPDQPLKVSGALYARLLARFNEELRAVCAQHGVACFDLAAEVPQSPDYFYDMVHFNDAGARRVGEQIARFLQEHVLTAGGGAA